MDVLFFIAAAAAAAGSGGADAPAEPDAGVAAEARFARLDRNGDGAITANEAPRVVRTRCDCAPSGAQPAAGGWLAGYDRDGDLRVTAAEFAAAGRGGTETAARSDPPIR